MEIFAFQVMARSPFFAINPFTWMVFYFGLAVCGVGLCWALIGNPRKKRFQTVTTVCDHLSVVLVLVLLASVAWQCGEFILLSHTLQEDWEWTRWHQAEGWYNVFRVSLILAVVVLSRCVRKLRTRLIDS